MAAQRLRSIEDLRGIAAFAVVIFHAGQWSGLNASLGAAGVDLFFVISGYSLWRAVSTIPPSPLVFLQRRALRILPLYWMATLAVAGLTTAGWLRLPEPAATSGHLLASMMLIPHLDPAGQPFPVLAQGWTLTYEAAFYLILAIGLCLPVTWRYWSVFSLLIGLLAYGYFHPTAYQLLANGLLLEFVIGISLARLDWRLAQYGARTGLGCIAIGVLLLLVSGLIFVGDPGNWRWIAWGLPAGLVLAGNRALEASGGYPHWRWRTAIGTSSYSLYLTHRMIIAALAGAMRSTPPAMVFLAEIAGALTAGMIVYWLIERPLLNRIGYAPRV